MPPSGTTTVRNEGILPGKVTCKKCSPGGSRCSQRPSRSDSPSSSWPSTRISAPLTFSPAGPFTSTSSSPDGAAASSATSGAGIVFTDQPIKDYRDTLKADTAILKRFNQALRARGIMKGDSKYYVSVAHTRADIDHTIGAWEEALKEIK